MRTRAITAAQMKVFCGSMETMDILALKLMRETGLRVSDILRLVPDQLVRSGEEGITA